MPRSHTAGVAQDERLGVDGSDNEEEVAAGVGCWDSFIASCCGEGDEIDDDASDEEAAADAAGGDGAGGDDGDGSDVSEEDLLVSKPRNYFSMVCAGFSAVLVGTIIWNLFALKDSVDVNSFGISEAAADTQLQLGSHAVATEAASMLAMLWVWVSGANPQVSFTVSAKLADEVGTRGVMFSPHEELGPAKIDFTVDPGLGCNGSSGVSRADLLCPPVGFLKWSSSNNISMTFLPPMRSNGALAAEVWNVTLNHTVRAFGLQKSFVEVVPVYSPDAQSNCAFQVAAPFSQAGFPKKLYPVPQLAVVPQNDTNCELPTTLCGVKSGSDGLAVDPPLNADGLDLPALQAFFNEQRAVFAFGSGPRPLTVVVSCQLAVGAGRPFESTLVLGEMNAVGCVPPVFGHPAVTDTNRLVGEPVDVELSGLFNDSSYPAEPIGLRVSFMGADLLESPSGSSVVGGAVSFSGNFSACVRFLNQVFAIMPHQPNVTGEVTSHYQACAKDDAQGSKGFRFVIPPVPGASHCKFVNSSLPQKGFCLPGMTKQFKVSLSDQGCVADDLVVLEGIDGDRVDMAAWGGAKPVSEAVMALQSVTAFCDSPHASAPTTARLSSSTGRGADQQSTVTLFDLNVVDCTPPAVVTKGSGPTKCIVGESCAVTLSQFFELELPEHQQEFPITLTIYTDLTASIDAMPGATPVDNAWVIEAETVAAANSALEEAASVKFSQDQAAFNVAVQYGAPGCTQRSSKTVELKATPPAPSPTCDFSVSKVAPLSLRPGEEAAVTLTTVQWNNPTDCDQEDKKFRLQFSAGVTPPEGWQQGMQYTAEQLSDLLNKEVSVVGTNQEQAVFVEIGEADRNLQRMQLATVRVQCDSTATLDVGTVPASSCYAGIECTGEAILQSCQINSGGEEEYQLTVEVTRGGAFTAAPMASDGVAVEFQNDVLTFTGSVMDLNEFMLGTPIPFVFADPGSGTPQLNIQFDLGQAACPSFATAEMTVPGKPFDISSDYEAETKVPGRLFESGFFASLRGAQGSVSGTDTNTTNTNTTNTNTSAVSTGF